MIAASAGVIVVFAKAPHPGRVKTRMTPPLSPEQAAALYAAMLADVLAATAAFARALRLEPITAVDPPAARAEIAAGAPAAFRVVAQRGADLSARMSWAVREAAAGGAPRILLRGSDSPALDARAAGAVLRALDESDVAVCPDRDGGYNLVGLRRPAAGLFAHPMSTRTVLEDTLANARASGLGVAVHEPGFDIDTIEDLRHLARARTDDSGLAQLCPRTLGWLDRHGVWDATH